MSSSFTAQLRRERSPGPLPVLPDPPDPGKAVPAALSNALRELNKDAKIPLATMVGGICIFNIYTQSETLEEVHRLGFEEGAQVIFCVPNCHWEVSEA